jgi:hypothetical protein
MKKRLLSKLQLCATVFSMILVFHSVFAQAQMPEVTVTVFHDLVRFAAPGEVQEMRVEVFSATGEKIFDSTLVAGQIQDWPLQNMQGKAVDSGLYAYTVTVKDQAGSLKQMQRGNLLVGREREGIETAPPINQAYATPSENIQPQPTRSWDVDSGKNPYVINTPTMGIGTQKPLARLHVGAGTAEPLTQGSSLLLEEGAATGMVLKSTTGGEMFFSQDKNYGLFGTASNHPFGIRTNNENRLWITSEGHVGIGTTTPGSPLTVAGGIEMTSGGLKFPDGTIQTTAANATSDSPTSNASNNAKGADQNSAANQNNSSGKKGIHDKTVSPEFSVNEDLTINGNIIFTPPSPQFTRDITMQNNNGGLRFFGAPTLTNSPAAAAIQFWGNNSPFPGQLYLDSGAHNNGAVIIRTTGTGGTITERMRVTASGNVGIGTNNPSPSATLDVAGAVNTSSQYNIGGSRVLSVAGSGNTFTGVGAGTSNTGSDNSFFGTSAGQLNTTGFQNSFFGSQAGISNTTGGANSFFGFTAGYSNTTGGDNSFFGKLAGYSNTTGSDNAFFGFGAGLSNTTGGSNAFFGNFAGDRNTTANSNAFFGFSTGYSNTTGSDNAFFGFNVGFNNTTGTGNTFVGHSAGLSNTTENNNTLLGSSANGAAGITNATAIGTNASVTQSNSLVLGSINGVNSATADVNVGIGTSAPKAKLHVKGGDMFIANPNSLIITSPNGSCFQIRVDNAGALFAASVACPN